MFECIPMGITKKSPMKISGNPSYIIFLCATASTEVPNTTKKIRNQPSKTQKLLI